MKAQRNRYSADFKAKLVLEVIQGNRTLNEIASEAKVHPNLLTQWKRQLLESLPAVFSDKRVKENKDQEELTGQLYQQIGQLKVELDWLKKAGRPGHAAQSYGPVNVERFKHQENKP